MPSTAWRTMKSEHEMQDVLKTFLEGRGYHVLFSDELGGRDFFDCIAVGDDVGAIELKLSGPKKACQQAYARLQYVNWAAILMPHQSSLSTAGGYDWIYGKTSARHIGLWLYTEDGVYVCREPETHDPPSDHTIKMIQAIKKAKERGISNEVIWGHERGVSLYGLRNPTRTMYRKRVPDLPLKTIEDYEDSGGK